MDINVYCDESQSDLFASKHSTVPFLIIGSLWLPADRRNAIKQAIGALKKEHRAFGELKWNKVSRSKRDFYLALVDFFFSLGMDLRFRCIAVEVKHVDLDQFHKSDHELGFYKFYYQLIQHWIAVKNSYLIFCDFKTNREPGRLQVLKECLQYTNLAAEIKHVQALPSDESVLIQLVDFLTGAASARLNGALRPGSVKEEIVKRIEQRLGIEKISGTAKSEQKFNVFMIQLAGEW